LPKGTEKITEIISQDSWCRGPYFERGNFQRQIFIFGEWANMFGILTTSPCTYILHINIFLLLFLH